MIVVVSRIPGRLTPLGDWLAEIAHDVALVTSLEVAEDFVGVFPIVIPVESYSSGPAMEAALHRLCQENDVERIVHVTEEDVLRAARARDAHGIPGQSFADAIPFRDKAVMKEHIRGTNLRVPRFCAPKTLPEALDFAAAQPGPLVLKPRSGYASAGVRVVDSADELSAELARRGLDDVLIEQFVPGPVHHVDGVTDDGQIVFACPSRYVNDCLSYQESLPLGSLQLAADDPLAVRLIDFAETVLATMPKVSRTPFHLEVIEHRDNGELYFCEVACRLGGGHIPQALTYRTGVNPARAWIRHQAGLDDDADSSVTLSDTLYGFALLPPRPGRLESVESPSLPGYVREFHLNVSVPHEFTGATASTDSVIGFVVEGPSSVELDTHLRDFVQTASDLMRWA